MSTEFPKDDPGDIYERGLTDQSDIYAVVTGPAETKGYGPNIPLFYIETEVGEAPDADEVSRRLEVHANSDPQGPIKLTYEELAAKALGYQAAVREEKQQQTDDFEALMGISQRTS